MTTRPFCERHAVRLVVLDAQQNILLLHTRDLSSETFGTAWELPGGGIEAGESFAVAAARELEEETGIRISATAVGQPLWRRDVLYSYRGERRLQHESVAVVRLQSEAPAISAGLRVAFESEDHFEHRWWRQQDIACSSELFFPRSLPVQLPRLLRGAEIVEPLEIWP